LNYFIFALFIFLHLYYGAIVLGSCCLKHFWVEL